MNVRLPVVLYKSFPLFCVLLGFFSVMLIRSPVSVAAALYLYTYSFVVLYMRW